MGANEKFDNQCYINSICENSHYVSIGFAHYYLTIDYNQLRLIKTKEVSRTT